MSLYKRSLFFFCVVFLVQSFFLYQNRTDDQEVSGVGYRVGKVQQYRKLKTSGKSALYQIVASELDDGRPLKLLNLSGSHYDVGFDYGSMLADEIEFSYKMLFETELQNNTLLIQVMQTFLDWQYQSYVRKSIPYQFLNEIKGIKDGALKSRHIKNINKLLQRVLVISNFPGELQNDIPNVLFDQFFKSVIHLRNEKIQNYVQSNLFYVIHKVRQFIKKNAIMCSFFGVWGNRTKDGDLFTMRNLDWASNTGINLNKLVIVFNIDGEIPHAILAFPGLIGALTGISAKGITVHEAGQSSELATMEGFQWTLRMRYIMMKATNLQESLKIWNQTQNTLGMNFMLGSSADKKAVVIEAMRGYSAIFYDNDPRENRTIFTDKNGNKFVGGYSMPEAVFRTNHAYDPIIQKHSVTKTYSKNSDTMIRYFILKDVFNYYSNSSIKITELEALNLTAILGDKGSEKFYSCSNNYKGENVISVMYQPSKLKMWAAFEYGYKETFRSACCGVYLQIDLTRWFVLR